MSRNLLYFALLAGCFIKPNRVDPSDGGGDDGNGFHDARTIDVAPPNPQFVPKVIANAHYSNASATPMNSAGHYYLAVPPTSIHAGDLLVIVGNVDNKPQWHAPDQTWQVERNVGFGADGQTFVVFTKIANASEPDHYEALIDNVASGACAVTLLAIPKAGSLTVRDRTDPACGSAGGCGASPVLNIADPVTTTVDNTMVIFAAGVDWLDQDGALATTIPTGFIPLAAYGDKDDQHFWWTSLIVAYKIYPDPQTTPALTATESSTINGMSWAVTIAIQPAP